MFQFLTRFSVNLATFFILSEQVSQNCNFLIKRPNVILEYLSFQLGIQEVLCSDLTQAAGRVDLYFMSIVMQVNLLLFPSIGQVMNIYQLKNLIYGLLQIMKFYACEYKKHREFPLCFQTLKTLPFRDRPNSALRSSIMRSTSTPLSRSFWSRSWYSGMARRVSKILCRME